MLEQHSHYQTHQKKCDEFQHNNQNQSISYKNSQNKYTQFDPPNSYTRQPSKSLLKSANTTNIPISIEKENTTLQVPPGNGKENSKSTKVKGKVILVGDSILSGINVKSLSTDKFKTVVRDIPGATSDDMAHHTIPFSEKNPKKLIIHATTNDIYRNIDTIGNYEKIYNYVKASASKTELIFSEICCRGDRKGVMNEVKTLNKKIEEFCKSKNLALIRHSDVNQNCLAKKKLHLQEKGI